MSVVNAAIFGVIAAFAVGGADYAMTMKKHVGEEYGLLDHLEFRFSRVMSGSGVATALPAAPTGWDVRDATIEDSLRITGLPVDPAKLATMTAMNEKLIAAIPGLQTEDRVYQKGDAKIFLDISFVPANMKDIKLVKAMSWTISMVDGNATDVSVQPDSAVAWRRYSGPDYGNAVMYYAVPDGQIFISALSTASEADTLSLLAGVDIAVLQMLVMEDRTIGKPAGVMAEDAPEKAAACEQKGAAKFCSATN